MTDEKAESPTTNIILKAKTMKQFLLSVLLMSSFCLAGAQSIWYVKESASGDADGTSWINASANLQQIIDQAAYNDSVFVAAGTYHPGAGSYFSMKQGIKIYGGFAGNEGSLHERNLATSDTSILESHEKHVVFNDNNGLDGNAILDGFKITGGNATGDGIDKYGGGMYNNAASPQLTNLTISNNAAEYGGGAMANFNGSDPILKKVVIRDNTSPNQGAGIYNASSSPILDSVLITANIVGIEGGGMYSTGAAPLLTNVTITGNTSHSTGGGLYNNSSMPVLNHVTISNNTADYGGGAIFNEYSSPKLTDVILRNNTSDNGGAVFNLASYPVSQNVVITNNTANSNGGGIYNRSSPYNSPSPELRSVVISNNSAVEAGGGIYNESSSPILTNATITGNSPDAIFSDEKLVYIKNCIIWGNKDGLVGSDYSATEFSLVQGMAADNLHGNIDGNTDPAFVDMTVGNFQLQSASPAINTGTSDTAGLNLPLTDLAGNPRIISARIDMGAYENQSSGALPVEIHGFSGTLHQGTASLSWESGVETSFDHYEIEKHNTVSAKGSGNISTVVIAPRGSNSNYRYELPQQETIAYYRLKFVNTDGKSIYYNKVVSLTQNNDQSSILVYPSPARDVISIKVASACIVDIYDAGGRLVTKQSIPGGVNQIDIRGLSAGIYCCVVNGQKIKFVKR